MKSIHFKESTIELKKPASMTDEECKSLHVYQNPDGSCISCWTVSFLQRLKFLFHGKIWLGVCSGQTQPPVWLDCAKTIFKPKVDKRLFWLGIINEYFIQLFFIRIFSNREEGTHTHYGILYWVWPFTGWTTNYKIIGEKIKYKHFKKPLRYYLHKAASHYGWFVRSADNYATYKHHQNECNKIINNLKQK